MALVGALAAAGVSLRRAWTLPELAPAQPEAWATAQRRDLRRQLALAAALAAVAAGALAFGQTLAAGFAAMAGLLLGAALALPAVLAALLALGARLTRRPVAQWAWADARQQLSGLSLALMALLVALAVNVGVGTMVDSFRRTFFGYLDRRLVSDIYVTADDEAQARAVADWLAARPEVAAVLPIWQTGSRFRDWPIEVYGFRDHATYRENWPLIAALPDAWDRVADGRAALVSEQLARRFALNPGDDLEIPTPRGSWRATVAAIYPDYGNPEGQMMVAAATHAAQWPDADRRRMGVRTTPGSEPGLAEAVRAAFALDAGRITDQRAVKDAARRVFEKTFAVTVALNALTLVVAGIALLTSLLALADARLTQLAPLWAMGLTRRQLARVELVKALALAALTAVLALPLGLALAWLLTAVINVRAFGWRLPMHLFPGQWATLLALALATALAAALWPAWRLARASPLRLLQGFSNER
jgi:putative ABC transport system permease protein